MSQKLKWNNLESVEQLAEVQQQSKEHPVLIFKHSTRCSISRTALDRLERNWNSEEAKNIQPYFLDLIAHRDVSNTIATTFQVQHESPQVLIIENGQSVYDKSHLEIDFKSIKSFVASH
ncbi:MAG: bacillithiol system redox-active protein YtxJ [Azospira oryzae]|jgi:bacillithiol system protein YtxJ|nr:MAG: bacillithiol system redox-active protein YtxJ [Azospira oryzae]